MTVSPGKYCGGYCGSMGYQGRWYEPFGPVRADSVFSAQNQAFSQEVLDCQGFPLSSILFVIFKDRMSRCSRGEASVRFGDLRIASLLFADNVVLLAISGHDLQHTLGRFAPECEAVAMRFSPSNSEAMVLCQKMLECSLQDGSELLPQGKEFKYLGVFTIEGKMEREMDRPIGASAVMRALYRSVVVKRDLTVHLRSKPAYGHKLWVVTERTRSRIQAAKMSFLRRVAGLSLKDRVRSSDIRRELRVELLLLPVKRSQLRWFGHLIRMPPGRLPLEVFRARPNGRRPWGRHRTRWRDYISHLAWECLRIPREELESVAGEKEAWGALLSQLPPATQTRISGREWMDGWMDGWVYDFHSEARI